VVLLCRRAKSSCAQSLPIGQPTTYTQQISAFFTNSSTASSIELVGCRPAEQVRYIHLIPPFALKPRFSVDLLIFSFGGMLGLACGGSRKFHAVTAVNTVYSRYSHYNCGFLPFAEVAELPRTTALSHSKCEMGTRITV